MDSTVPLAPLAGWAGQVEAKPWDFPCTVSLPHLDTFPQVALALELWRLQSVRPYLQVVDTGSPGPVLANLEALRADDCEVHYIRAHAYRHPSSPVCAALDLAQALCRTEFLVHAHTDVFPVSRELLAWLIGQCSRTSPVVGWQMSPRDGSTAPSKDEWQYSVSHTCTILHMPTVHLAGLTWSMERYFAERPSERGHFAAWPDTESPFFLSMRRAGIVPVLLGPERNFERDRNDWWDHSRSYTGLKASSRDGTLGTALRWSCAQYTMALAEREARARLEEWRQSPL